MINLARNDMINAVATLAALALFVATPARMTGQQQRPTTAASVMGTYGLGTRELPSLREDACWLETAPLGADSLRIQIRCSRPPAHHLGMLDQRLQFSHGTAVYDTNKFGGRCRIAVRFAAATAVVTQEGSDQACGFGAYVTVGGTYGRISSQRPSFDLVPVERQH
jgi:hypothetical protein